MSSLSIAMPVAAALLAIVSGAAGILLATRQRARFLVPASGILLVAITVFALIPELRERIGWPAALALPFAGFLALAFLDKAGVSVCPSCQHGEAFAVSLVAAVGVHAFVDGWALVATARESGPIVSHAIAGAMLLHKIPEGLALGSMLRAATPRISRAAALLVATEGTTVAGGLCGFWSPPGLWTFYLLALAGGTFLFLGLHALDLRKRPARENSF